LSAPEPPTPVFEAPWQAEAFALVVHLHDRGAFTWAEWAEGLHREIKGAEARGEADVPYYDHWLAALEAVVSRRGLAGPGELAARREAWAEAWRHTPHGQPVRLP
jgi:nitrile hydratase accessory protein